LNRESEYITVNRASRKELLNFLNACDNNFSPRLSSRVNIEEYSLKLYSKAVNFEYWLFRQLIGMVSMYTNREQNNSGYITNVSVIGEYAGKGIASQLLRNCLEFSKKQELGELKLEVSKENEVAIKLYKKFGFSFFEANEYSFIMQLKLALRRF